MKLMFCRPSDTDYIVVLCVSYDYAWDKRENILLPIVQHVIYICPGLTHLHDSYCYVF